MIGGQNGVRRAVERIARVVGHAAVYGNVVPHAGDLLDRADGVERHACIRDDAAARLEQDDRHREAAFGAPVSDERRDLAEVFCKVKRGIVRCIAHTVSAAKVELLCRKIEFCLGACHEIEHDRRRAHEHVRVEHLRADMTVQPHDIEVRHGKRIGQKGFGLSGLNRDAELGIDKPGRDRRVGVRVDARGQPQKDGLPQTAPRGLRFNGVQFFRTVDNKEPDAAFHRKGDVRAGLDAAVKIDVRHRKACGFGGCDLAGRNDIKTQALFFHYLRHSFEGCGLGCIKNAESVPERAVRRVGIRAAVLPNAILVHQVQRRAVLRGKRRAALSRKVQVGTLYADIVANHLFHSRPFAAQAV